MPKVMRPDARGQLRPAEVVDLLDEISRTLQTQGGNDALAATLQQLALNLDAVNNQIAQLSARPDPTIPPAALDPLIAKITDALSNLPTPSGDPPQLPRQVTAELSPQALELLSSLAPKQDSDVLALLAEKLELLDFRLKGVGQAFGSSGPSNIASDPSREIGKVSNFPADYPDSTAHTKLDTLATQATLADILADLTAKRNGTGSEPVYTSSSVGFAIGQGLGFTSGMTMSVSSGSEGTFSIANPSASGKVIKILKMHAANDNTSQIRFKVYENSTIDALATSATPWDPNRSTRSTSIAELRYGSGIRSGGTDLDTSVPVSLNEPYKFKGLIILPPGRSLQLTGTVPGALSAQQLTVVGNWLEEPI